MESSFEERKSLYIQRIEEEYAAPAKNYWQQPPVYIPTGNYALQNQKAVNVNEPMLFKKTKSQGTVITVMIIVAAVLLYMLGKKEAGFGYVGFLLVLLIVVLPILLTNKTMIRFDRESMRLYPEWKEIKWRQVILTYISQVYAEDTKQFFIVHYYEEDVDEFRRSEVELTSGLSAGLISAAVEAYRSL